MSLPAEPTADGRRVECRFRWWGDIRGPEGACFLQGASGDATYPSYSSIPHAVSTRPQRPQYASATERLMQFASLVVTVSIRSEPLVPIGMAQMGHLGVETGGTTRLTDWLAVAAFAQISSIGAASASASRCSMAEASVE